MNAELLARDVRLIILDVDGVLTDGGLYYDESGCVMKRFNVQDGLAIKMAPQVGIEFAVITGLDSPAVRRRVTELGISHYYPGHHRKAPILRRISEETGIPLAQMAYVGDDWVDAAPMSLVGLPIAVPNARPEILKLAAWTTRSMGGQGAVREAIDFILRAQGKLEALWQDWVRE
ncbi:3-deoxy-D-manno-octulosonate 8-phosphate phosphatase (KDO 8-P phosphatase) [Desulfomicrobium macestii]|uniref:3-deoxy-D-manno-octulosonate 8-phosphate phosphatase (KDO 8-P phosphatase) n=2 Tax=Desulfomicrobium TaxID=898 RepID=A0A8G2C694_DESNO|nr:MULTISPECIES: HAD hydrolase family protein [Desulfomicrobium]MBE1426436.1 3-deoxy-D-manno-octulosonate 8-phosphate phosphatase (KDO 8-P phosphatase) [Desulfomicrobium macestii]SFM22728.1 3-deoxy-D-manno-octulosonate 8-phosphate phosphatase (KDO 8-P phosphatase) [Desulfomicrobium norvegicum]